MNDVTAPRRICLVTETYPPEINGVALTLARLVGGLRARGHAVSVVRPRQPSDGRGGGGERGRDPELTLVSGLGLPGYKEVRVGLPAAGTLRDCWNERRPDAVYVATEGPLGCSAVRTANRLGVPVFSGFHTSFADYAGHYGLGWLAPVVQGYLRRLHNRTRGTLVASAELRRQLLGIGFNDVQVLGRGVDGELFDPARRTARLRATWGAGSTDLVALYVGRLAPEKNVPLAVEAYRAMQRVQCAARCVIVGDGPLRGALEKAHPDLVFCGMRTGAALAAHYASADVFLFPSETETFGNVTLEAMASGLAVVAYDYAAARIHVTHGESGVLAPRGDARAFVEGAAALARRPECLPEMRRCARAHAASVDWPSVVAAFEALLTCPVVERAGYALATGPSGRRDEPQPEARRADTESPDASVSDGRAAAGGEASGYGSRASVSDGRAAAGGEASGYGSRASVSDGRAAAGGEASGYGSRASVSDGRAAAGGEASGYGSRASVSDGRAAAGGEASGYGSRASVSDGRAAAGGEASGYGSRASVSDGRAAAGGEASGYGSRASVSDGRAAAGGEASGYGSRASVSDGRAAAGGEASGYGSRASVSEHHA